MPALPESVFDDADAPTTVLVPPGSLTIGPDGVMVGRTAGYDKLLGDMRGVYLDEDAYAVALQRRGAASLVYHVDEHSQAQGAGALIIGTSTLLPGRIGDEFAVTRGHLHAKADRAELYYCLSGRGVMLLETLSGESRALPIANGQAVHVPGDWIHRSVNVGNEPFVTLFCYAADSGQNYQLIADAGGMATLVVTDRAAGWTTRPNPRHIGYRLAQS